MLVTILSYFIDINKFKFKRFGDMKQNYLKFSEPKTTKNFKCKSDNKRLIITKLFEELSA